LALKVRVGIIGVGGMGQTHLKTYHELTNVEMTAICDADKEIAKKTAVEYSIPNVFTNYNEMLSFKDLDAVSICTPNFLHAQISITALEADKHVLCEKPLAMNAIEAEKIAKKVKETGKKFVVGYWIPHTAEGKTLKQFVDSGKLGEIYLVKTGWIRKYMFQNPRWFSVKAKSGGGPLMDIGVHALDAALWIMGYPDPVAVVGSTYTGIATKHLYELYNDTQSIFDVEDTACAIIKLKGGATIFLEASWAGYMEKGKLYLDLYGTKGGVAFEWNTPCPLRFFTNEERTPSTITPDLVKIKKSNAMEYFIDCITRDEQPTIATIEHGFKVMQIIDAIYQSAKTNREVQF
jgi:predicted dehydrogenase